MNDWDRDNLNFLLNASKADMDDWWQHASQDDIEYAANLFKQAKTEIELQLLDLLETAEELDLSQAQTVLSRFRL